MFIPWPEILAGAAAGAGAVYAIGKLRPERKLLSAEGEAVAVNTLRDVILELRSELEHVRARLIQAETLVEDLTGERLPKARNRTTPGTQH